MCHAFKWTFIRSFFRQTQSVCVKCKTKWKHLSLFVSHVNRNMWIGRTYTETVCERTAGCHGCVHRNRQIKSIFDEKWQVFHSKTAINTFHMMILPFDISLLLWRHSIDMWINDSMQRMSPLSSFDEHSLREYLMTIHYGYWHLLTLTAFGLVWRWSTCQSHCRRQSFQLTAKRAVAHCAIQTSEEAE